MHKNIACNYAVSTNINIASVGENVCIDVPALGVLFAVWPNSPANRSLGDCECPLCNQGDCRLELCHCINDSIYTITLQSDHSKYKLCFHDITVEMNGTFVHFYYDRIKCDEFPTAQGTFLPVPGIYRLYIASNWIIIKGDYCHIQLSKYSISILFKLSLSHAKLVLYSYIVAQTFTLSHGHQQ